MNRLTYKKLKIGLGLWASISSSLLILPSIALCQDSITVPLPDAKKMVVMLEKTNLYEKQVALLEKANIQLTEQNTLLLEQNKILKDQLVIKQSQLDLATKELENQKQVYEDKIKGYEKDKPSFIDKVFIGVGGAGIGVIIGAVLVLLL